MEITSRTLERENPSPINSPTSNGSSSNSNGIQIQNPTPPLTPKTTISRSETNPYPTTFVQANADTFKHVVQMLTGSSETAKQVSKTTPTSDPPISSSSSKNHIPPLKTGQKKQGFKLYERRNQLKNGFMISPLMSGFNQSSVKPEILSPSMLNFPALVLSPVTPLIEDPFHISSPAIGSSSEEEKAIAEKGFYLHPSPRNTTPRDSEPQLLPLFPVTSPRVSSGSNSSN